MALYYLQQYISKTLNTTGGIDASQTADIELPDVTGIDYTKPGIACISYTDPLDTDSAEWITYTSINNTTKKFVGVTRGTEGYSAKAHAKGVIIAFPLSESHINNLNDEVNTLITSVADLTSTVTTATSSATPTPTGDTKYNELYITALAEASELQAPSGTPVNGNKLLVRILDDATARALTYNAIYTGTLADLPSTTTISKTLYMLFLYNSEAVKWELASTGEEG